MQDRTWTITTMRDGRVYQDVSNSDAMKVIRRAMYGLEPFEEQAAAERSQGSHGVELPLAA